MCCVKLNSTCDAGAQQLFPWNYMVIKMANLLLKVYPGLIITAPHWMCAVALLGGEESQEGSGGGEAGFWVKFLLPSIYPDRC